MKPTAIFIDIDRTLTDHKDNMKVSMDDIHAIKNAQKEGIYIVLATGRDDETTLPVWKQIHVNDYAKFTIHSNGSVLENFVTKEKAFEKTIDKELAKQIIDYGHSKGYAFKLSLDQTFYVEKPNFWMNLLKPFYHVKFDKYSNFDFDKGNYRKIGLLTGKSRKKTKKIEQELKAMFPQCEVARTGSGFYVELTAKGVSKATAAQELAKNMGWDLKNCVAIGDSMNDYAIFKVVGHPVAMGNSLPELKKIAKYHTDTVKKSGVSKAIKSIKELDNDK